MPQGLCTRGCKQGWSVGGIAAPSASQLSFADHHIAQNQQKDNDKDNNKDKLSFADDHIAQKTGDPAWFEY